MWYIIDLVGHVAYITFVVVRYCLRTKFCKTENITVELWPETVYNMVAVYHFEFTEIRILCNVT